MKDKNLFVCAYNVRRGSGTPQSATWGKKQFVDVFRYTAPGPDGYGYYDMPKFIQITTDINNENILKIVPFQPRDLTDADRLLLTGPKNTTNYFPPGDMYSEHDGYGGKTIRSRVKVPAPKKSKYTPTSRKVLKNINGVTRERKVWMNKDMKEFVRVKVDGKFVYKKV